MVLVEGEFHEVGGVEQGFDGFAGDVFDVLADCFLRAVCVGGAGDQPLVAVFAHVSYGDGLVHGWSLSLSFMISVGW